MSLHELLEALLIKYLCSVHGVQNCHCCYDTDCCDNLQGGLHAWNRALRRKTTVRTSSA